jgi:hypothetical protein
MKEAIIEVIIYIYNSILNNEPLIVSANNGLNTILTIKAALKSNSEKKKNSNQKINHIIMVYFL